ncbi:MAG: hypothetical protein HZB75_01625 [Candidatus Saccharibacteria bacterium]|nr:MAG: hypothetical protein HZB75_01625 [Candidatus Saccharibacteria bacterium]
MNKKLLSLGIVAALVAGYAAARNRHVLASAASTGRDRVKAITDKVGRRRRNAPEGEEQASDA